MKVILLALFVALLMVGFGSFESEGNEIMEKLILEGY
jgi:hypothetical protein